MALPHPAHSGILGAMNTRKGNHQGDPKSMMESTLRRIMTVVCLLPAVVSTSEAGKSRTPEIGICEAEMWRASQSFQVPLQVLYAVGLTETGRKGRLHPYALNVEGEALFPTSRAEAMRLFEASRAKGAQLIDLGCMQVNHHYHGDQFNSPADMLDPRQNVTYAARFLKALRLREGSWSMAIARYHAGPKNDPAHRRYTCKVIENLVATGFGQWTAASSSFCGRR